MSRRRLLNEIYMIRKVLLFLISQKIPLKRIVHAKFSEANTGLVIFNEAECPGYINN